VQPFDEFKLARIVSYMEALADTSAARLSIGPVDSFARATQAS